MLFHTTQFAMFFAVVWSLYWIVHRHARARLVLLTIASWGFYAAWDWRFLGLLWLSTAIDYLCARQLARTEDPGRRRLWMGTSVVVNLGVLAAFKYFNFFASSAAAVLQAFGMQPDWPTLHIILPVGISFYTFQTLSYTIDVYRRRIDACDDPWAFSAYVAFFPQLVAGPIERAEHLLPRLREDPVLRANDQIEGARRFLVGLWKKLVVADNLGAYVDWVFATPSADVAPYQVVLGTLAFAGQIWADFSGYTDMALGVARTLGVSLSENFDAPYLARGPRDFWRRWHITLSTWLRDYVYVSIGGNRHGPARTALALGITMLLGGLWHGAAWTFVVWGAFHGAWLAVDRVVDRWRGRDRKRPAWSVVPTFALVCLGWLIFRAPDLSTAVGYLHALSRLGGSVDPALWIDGAYVLHFGWPVLVLHAVQRLRPGIAEWSKWMLAIYAAVSLLGEPIARHDAPFIYFQF